MSLKASVDPKEAYILVVEDNLQNAVLISRLLDRLGVSHYEWKSSGWELLEVANKMPRLDLVLLDLNLPLENGYEVLAKLRNDPRFAQTRIVAVTGDSDQTSMAKAKKAGFDGFLGKPIVVSKFPEQITDILRGKPVWDLGR
ncbi:MAG: response regulator [Anaerolineae bacterium]|nr:response regulator [Anaerolineae bacterium]